MGKPSSVLPNALGALLMAQALGEYAGSGGFADFGSVLDSTVHHVEVSLKEHGLLWFGAVLLLLVWLFRRN